jgi:hypothetical protein
MPSASALDAIAFAREGDPSGYDSDAQTITLEVSVALPPAPEATTPERGRRGWRDEGPCRPANEIRLPMHQRARSLVVIFWEWPLHTAQESGRSTTGSGRSGKEVPMTTYMTIGVRFIPRCGFPFAMTEGFALNVRDRARWRGLAAG